MKTETKPVRVLVLCADRSASYGRYVHITGHISHASDAHTEGFRDQPYGCDSEILNVRVSSQADERANEFYALELGYRAHDKVTLEESQRAVKLLAPIERRLAKMYATEGSPQGIGAWINRVARATGCAMVIIFNRERHEKTGNGYQSHSVGDAVFAVRHMATELLDWARGVEVKQAA